MIFIENPITFFENVESLIKKMWRYVEEREEEDQGLLLFKTPALAPNTDEPLIRALCIEKSEDSKVEEDSAYDILHHFQMCQYSLDNEQYFDIQDTQDNEEIQDIFSYDPKAKDYKLYIRDITGTFYTAITPASKKFFEFMHLNDITESEEDWRGDRTTLYYHNLTWAFYIYKRKFDIDVTPDEIDTVTYTAFYKNEDDDVCWKLTPLSFDDIVDSREYFFSDEPEYPALIEQINDTCKKYAETFGSSSKQIDLFGNRIALGYEPEKLSTAVLACGLDYLLKNDEWHLEESKNIFNKLIKNTVAENNMFDAERFVNNFKEAVEHYWGENSFMRPKFKKICKNIPQTALMYTVWDEYIDRKVFEETVLGAHQIIGDLSFLAPQLATLQYVEGFLSVMYEGYEQASRYKQDIDDFGNDLEIYGGGSGIGGALGGMLAATLVSAAAQTAYSAYKSSKFDSKKYEAIGKEFMVSRASQEFFKELIETDLIYLILKCFNSMNSLLQNAKLFKKFERHIDYSVVFENYIKAYKLYTIALAKNLKLAFLPVYEGLEEAHKKSSAELMQEALILFPYYAKYYEKYIEFGGEMSEELSIYASAHMVDLTALYEKEKALIEKRKQEEAEKKRLEEEKRKAEEERVKKELESLSKTFGDLTSQYPEVFKLLLDNPIYLENKDTEITDHIKISDAVFRYLSTVYSADQNTNLFSGTSEKFSNKKGNIKTVHGADKIKDNNVLMLFDITVFGSAKDGFVITNENICVRNSFEQPFAVAIKDIKKLSIKEKCLLINDKYKIDIGISCVKPIEFLHIFSYCICNLLHLESNGYELAPMPSYVASNQSTVSNENQFVNSAAGAFKSIFGKISSTLDSVISTPNTWKCSCGKDVSIENKFCPNCGAKQPEIASEWVCSSCGKKNTKESNFCGQCGTKKNI